MAQYLKFLQIKNAKTSILVTNKFNNTYKY